MPVVIVMALGMSTTRASTDSFQPLTVTLQPKVIQPVLPSWENENVVIEQTSDDLLIPVPSLASQDEIGCFALTVVFADNGDGGPVVEWRTKSGGNTLLSAGLGKTGVALGLNACTLLIPQSLALDGGTVRISYAGRFSRVISATLRPARELSVAALGADFIPSLLGSDEAVLTASEVSGSEETPQGGDVTEGRVVHAELSAEARQLDGIGAEGGTEFIIPLSAKPQGSLIQTQIAGLDPESRILISVNGVAVGGLADAPFSLNAPSTLLSPSGRIVVAGWHPASLFVPARLWKEGDNSIVLTLQRAAGDEAKSAFLRKARVDLLYCQQDVTPVSTSPTSTPAPSLSSGVTTTVANSQSFQPSATVTTSPTPSTPETLSTGSEYGNPSPSLFHAASPAVLPMQSSP